MSRFPRSVVPARFRRRIPFVPAAIALALALAAAPVSAAPASRIGWIHTDDDGTLRYPDGQEVRLWGVNYLAPFSVDYANLVRARADLHAAVDRDLDDLARLEMNLVRVRVTDREISDRDGNLLENPHLDLLDYVIAGCGKRGISVLLTPISWVESGAESTAGFSDGYYRNDLVNKRELWPAEERYLRAMADHVNPHTGIALKDDPAVALWEILHDPSVEGYTDDRIKPDTMVAYAVRMAGALRDAGVRQPLLYPGLNLFKDLAENERVFRDAKLDGLTLRYRLGESEGNPIVSRFFARRSYKAWIVRHAPDPGWGNGLARVMTEFDFEAAPQSYMFPAVAPALLAGRVQVAALTQYDPAAVAGWNAGYRLNYANLDCTPQKAVSLLVAGRLFRTLPLGEPLPDYADDEWNIAGCELSEAQDLVFWNDRADGALFYTRNPGDRIEGTLEDYRRVVGGDGSSLVSVAGPRFISAEVDREAGRITLELGPRSEYNGNPYETGRWDNNIRFVRRVVTLHEDPEPVTLGLADGDVAVFRAESDGTLTPVTRGAPTFEAAPGRYVVFLDADHTE